MSIKITQLPVASTISSQGVFLVDDGGIAKQLSYTTFRSLLDSELPIATTSSSGVVSVDGTTITINNGIISAAQYTLPIATTSTSGGVKVDGTTITINNGIISAVGGGGTGSANIIQSSVAPTGSTSTLWYDTVGGRSYVYYSGTWVDSNPNTLSVATTSSLGGVILDNTVISKATLQAVVAASTSFTDFQTRILGL